MENFPLSEGQVWIIGRVEERTQEGLPQKEEPMNGRVAIGTGRLPVHTKKRRLRMENHLNQLREWGGGGGGGGRKLGKNSLNQRKRGLSQLKLVEKAKGVGPKSKSGGNFLLEKHFVLPRWIGYRFLDRKGRGSTLKEESAQRNCVKKTEIGKNS